VDLLPGVRALLEGLRAEGFKQAVGSSAPKGNLDLILHLTQTESYFDAIVSAEDTQRGKPDPQVFQVAAAKLGVEPGRCVVLEDAVAGVEAAKAGGMKCIAVSFVGHHPESSLRQAGADLVVKNLEQVSVGTIRQILGSSQLLEFYRGAGRDREGRLLKEMWDWSDNELEGRHDYIQWMFPLKEASRFNPDAPLLTEEDIAAFWEDKQIQAHLQRSFERILAFLGLFLAEDGKVGEGPNFARRVPDVWSFPNHNWLRITRIISSLRILGREAQAQALFDCLATFYRGGRFPISADTFQYWTEAVQGVPFHA
jgi:hypothetical protein